MATMTNDEILDAIGNKTVFELAELIDAFKTKFNVTIAAAKVLSDFAKEFDQKPEVKGGLLEGKQIDVAQVKKLATLPSREQMLADLGAGLMSPMAAFVGALNGLLYMFAGALEGLRAQKEGAGA